MLVASLSPPKKRPAESMNRTASSSSFSIDTEEDEGVSKDSIAFEELQKTISDQSKSIAVSLKKGDDDGRRRQQQRKKSTISDNAQQRRYIPRKCKMVTTTVCTQQLNIEPSSSQALPQQSNQLKSILRAAKRVSIVAARRRTAKKCRLNDKPTQIIMISPRSGRLPGIVHMPPQDKITRRPLPHLPADPGLIPLMENGHVSAINGNHKVDADDDDIIVLEDTGAAKRSARRRSTCVPADSTLTASISNSKLNDQSKICNDSPTTKKNKRGRRRLSCLPPPNSIPIDCESDTIVDDIDESLLLDLLESQRSLFNRIRLKRAELTNSHQLWIDILRPSNSSEILCEKSIIDDVLRWMKCWKRRLDRVDNAGTSSAHLSFCIFLEPTKSQKNKKRRRNKIRSNADDDDEDSRDCEYELDETADLANPMLISGNVGCGKTSLVYAIANELNMRVIEVSANICRGSAQLKRTLSGAMNSHRVHNGGGRDIRQMLMSPSTSIESSTSPCDYSSNVDQHSVILIDDADILITPDDDGLWSTLRTFCIEAHIPIAITCQDAKYCQTMLQLQRSDYATSIDICHHSLCRPTETQLSDYLQTCILALRSIKIPIETLRDVCRRCFCDIRRSINMVQFEFVTTIGGIVDIDDEIDQILSTRRQRQQLLLPIAGIKIRPDYRNDIRDGSESPTTIADSYALVDNARIDVIEAVRRSLPLTHYWSGWHDRGTIGVDYCSYLSIMASTENATKRGRRRHLHYFDAIDGNRTMIDQYGELKQALVDYPLK